MKINQLSCKALILAILLCGTFSYDSAFSVTSDAQLPDEVRSLRREIRRSLVNQTSFDIGPYQSAPVLQEDTTMRDACFSRAPEQDKTVSRRSNADLPDESTLATDIDTVIGSVSDKCIPYKTTPKFSPLELNRWYLTSILDPNNQAKYYRNSGEKGSLYRAETGESGNRVKNASRLVRPDETMLNGCAQQLMVAEAGGATLASNPIWMRRELDNCLNQYILQQGRFPRINENYKGAYFGVNVGLCQPLRLQVPPSRYDRYEYAPSEYLGVAWRKLLVDSSYKKTNAANAEPSYINHSRVRVTRKIEMPEGTFGKILVPDLAEGGANGGEINLNYEKILDPSHPFSPRWDYTRTDRSLSMVGSQAVYNVRCAGVPVDIMTFRQGPFEASIRRKIVFNELCLASWKCRTFNRCSSAPNNLCCAVDYRYKDTVRGPFRRVCALPIADGCNFIARPLTPLNTLKMREVNSRNFAGGQAPEGYRFRDYFGTNKPYMRCWDSNTECGETSQTFPINGGIGDIASGFTSAGGLTSAAQSAFSGAGITNVADMANIANSGVNLSSLQSAIQSGLPSSLQNLAQSGLPTGALSNIGDIAKVANIPNVSNLANLAGQGVNYNQLMKMAGLSYTQISGINTLLSGRISGNAISKITGMPMPIRGRLDGFIQNAAGNPQVLADSLTQNGFPVSTGVASEIINNAPTITNAINQGSLPNVEIDAGAINTLGQLTSQGIDTSQIASSIIPNADNLSNAFSGLSQTDLGGLSTALGDPSTLANLGNLSGSLGNLGNVIPSGQLGQVSGLLGGGAGALSPSTISALGNASPAQLGDISSATGLASDATGGLLGGGTTRLLYNAGSTRGANYAILGAGAEGNNCAIGGGLGRGGVANPDPITSWSELKLYYVRSMRMNLKCIANHEKIFKYYTGEGGLLSDIGRKIPVLEPDSKGQLSTYGNVEMPFPWLGSVGDPDASRRFPNFGNANVNVQNLGTGLDGALPGDVLVFGPDLVRTGNPNADRNPYVGVVANADNRATREANGGGGSTSLEFVKIRAYNHGKYVDACGNTDMLGDSTVFTAFKTGLPQQYLDMFQEVGAGNNVPPGYHCVDPALSACIEPLWNNIPRYRIRAAY
jgi:hypothetical protein